MVLSNWKRITCTGLGRIALQISPNSKEYKLVTDHKPLVTIFGPRSPPYAHIERWVVRLQSFKYKIVYLPGKTNIVDPLSRLCRIFQEEFCFNDEILLGGGRIMIPIELRQRVLNAAYEGHPGI